LLQALQQVYPEYPWEDGLETRRKPMGYWKQNLANQRKFFDRIGKLLNVQKYEDWYNIRGDQVHQLGGAFIRKYYGGSLIGGM
jgi:hypothetical protein